MSRFGIVPGFAPLALLLVAPTLGGCAEFWMPRPVQTSVQEINGQRVDVPPYDLAPDGSGLLRNGLVPQPQQFN